MESRVLIPDELSLVLSLQPNPSNILEMNVALWSNRSLPPGTKFLPDQGSVRTDRLEVYSRLSKEDVRFEYGCQDDLVTINDRHIRHCNWIRFLKTSENLGDVNMFGVKVKDEVIFQTTKTILPNEEIVAYLQRAEDMPSEIESSIPDLGKVKQEQNVDIVSPVPFPGSRDLLTSPPSRDDDCKSRVSDGTHCSDISPHSTHTSETERYSDMDLSPPFASYPQQMSPLNLSSHRTPSKYRTPSGPASLSSPLTSGSGSPMTSPLSSSTEKSPSPSAEMLFRPKRNRERTWLPCDVCGKKFDRPSLLKRHIRTHTGEKPHACDVCGKAFSTSSSLNTHRRIHSGEKPHQCGVCGKRFTASSNLYYHRMTHNKDKPHKCQLCSKSFPTPGDLRSHMYVHNGSWPFKCDVCNRGFSKQTNLKNHLLLHTGDKPHECPTCEKKFALLCNLKTHLKTHEEDNQGSCVTCGRTYLKKHDVTSDQCIDCIRSASPDSSSPKHSRQVSDFSISKLTNSEDTRDKSPPASHPEMFDPRYLPSVYSSMMMMAPTAGHCVPPQPFSFGLVPVLSRFSSPDVRPLPYPAGLVPGLHSPMSMAEAYHAHLAAGRRDWSGLLAK